ncbi:MAG: ATP-binding cassette domain-containing protein [Dehalococcoidales bacterium]|nr:MAG: ATP-binding cassette domain-containing protein [Dehalococcoidales bacterium]
MIRVENLTKYYGKRLAVDDISFNVEKGEIVGFLGPNAAGKTTTMRIITGYLAPTQGNVWVADHDIINHSLEARRQIGYLPEAIPLYTDMTVRSYLDFAGRLRGMDSARIIARTDEVIEICHLEEYVDVIIGKLSKGFRQRVGVAQAIIHEPAVLILDEPTIGIDPIQVAMTRQLIRELGKDHTILLSTHILPEVSVICQRVIIIHEGRIVAEDRIDNLSSMMSGSQRFRLQISGPVKKITERLQKVKGIINVSYEESNYIIECAAGQDPRRQIMDEMVRGGWTLLSMEQIGMSLEDIFLKLTAEEEADE